MDVSEENCRLGLLEEEEEEEEEEAGVRRAREGVGASAASAAAANCSASHCSAHACATQEGFREGFRRVSGGFQRGPRDSIARLSV
jgi:hypothetical protein